MKLCDIEWKPYLTTQNLVVWEGNRLIHNGEEIIFVRSTVHNNAISAGTFMAWSSLSRNIILERTTDILVVACFLAECEPFPPGAKFCNDYEFQEIEI